MVSAQPIPLGRDAPKTRADRDGGGQDVAARGEAINRLDRV
jgi:hypothetical protein